MSRLQHALLLLGLVACAGDDVVPSDTDSGSVPTEPSEARIGQYLGGASRLVLEVDDVAGQPVPDDLWDDLAESLGELTGAPDVDVRSTSVSASGDVVWTAEALDALVAAEADEETDGDVHLHLLVLPGRYDADGVVLGRAWDHHHVALFVEAIDGACAAATQNGWSENRAARLCDATWKAVVSHEFGHVLGLVNQGLPMVEPHEDAAHPGHDAGEDCLMYWAFDGPGVASHLAQRAGSSGEVEDMGFCPASLADIAAF